MGTVAYLPEGHLRVLLSKVCSVVLLVSLPFEFSCLSLSLSFLWEAVLKCVVIAGFLLTRISEVHVTPKLRTVLPGQVCLQVGLGDGEEDRPLCLGPSKSFSTPPFPIKSSTEEVRASGGCM